MGLEILSIDLNDETISKLADAIVARMGGNQTVALSNPPSSELPGGPGASPSQGGADPWGVTPVNPAPQYQQPAQQPQVQPQRVPPQQPGALPTCAHGQMRYVPAGFSKSSGKAYQAFYGCPAPRGQQQCASVKAG